jgi:phosphate transport system protein
MAKRARKMVQVSIQAYVDRDAEMAESMVRRDDKLDKQYHMLFTETVREMSDDDYIRRATYLLWVGHNLERIGDRATNIAERVIFMTRGEFVENIGSTE